MDNNTNMNEFEKKAKDLGVPLIKPRKIPPSPDWNGTVAVCGVCGLELQKVMGYVCNRLDCPCFPKVIS